MKGTETMSHTVRQSIQLPFCGFYESVADWQIEETVNRAFDYEGTGCPEIPDDFWTYWDAGPVCKAYCKLYVERYVQYIKDKLDIDISLEFDDVVSPKFYNFETDRIFAYISHVDVCKLYNIVNTPALRIMVRERHSSRAGFASFYSNDLDDKEGEWGRELHEWDSVQLQTLLLAAFEQEGEEPDDTMAIMEDCMGSGELDNVVWMNASRPCLDMINEYDAKHRAA